MQLHDDTLICTSCVEIVRTTYGYDGYVARCSCSHFSLNPGGRSQPVSWERLEDATSPSKFSVTRDWIEDDGLVITSITCTTCKSTEHTSVSVSETSIPSFDAEITFTCDGDHEHYTVPRTETVFYNERDAEPFRKYTAPDKTTNESEPG